jgi:hypothetical protein
MMRIIKEEPFQDGLKYIEGFCLSTESKPTAGIITGSKMTEADTGDVYLFAEGDNPAWTKVAAGWVDPNP